MPLNQKIISSSSFDDLIKALAESLQQDKTALFAKHHICLPDLQWKKAMIDTLLSKQDVPILAGVAFKDLSKVLFSLVGEEERVSMRLPPKDLLALHILSKLDEGMEGFSPPVGINLPSHVYFKTLANKLSDAFIAFGKYGADNIDSFLKSNTPEARLFKEVYSYWDYPYKKSYNLKNIQAKPLHLHLFNFAFIPPIYRSILAALPSPIRVTYYQFSFARGYWTDTISDQRAIHALINAASQGSKAGPAKDLHSYMFDRNPLLANFGQLHLETKKSIDSSNVFLEERESLPKTKTHLSQVQEDIFTNTNREEGFFTQQDTTLTCLKFASKRDEVEHLFESIKELLERNPKLMLDDIRVYAPDMSVYAPFIKEVFSHGKKGIAHTFFDEKLLDTSSFIQCIASLFEVFKKPLTHKSFFDFFSLPFVCKAFNWKAEEVAQFSFFLKEANFVLGLEGGIKTLEKALERLIMNSFFVPQEKPVYPLPFIGKCDFERLTYFVHVAIWFSKQAVAFFEKKYTLADFCLTLKALIECLCSLEEMGPDGMGLKKVLDLLLQLEQAVGDKLFDVNDCVDYVLKSFNQKSGEVVASLNVIVCRDLTLNAFNPSDSVFVLGLNQDDFPRIKYSRVESMPAVGDFMPTPTDEDRALFLSLIVQTGLELHLSYASYSEQDGLELYPAPQLKALHHYIYGDVPIQEGKKALSNLGSKASLDQLFSQAPSCSIKGVVSNTLAITLGDLTRFVSHPIRYFFRSLGVRLPFKGDDKEEKASLMLKQRQKKQNGNELWHKAFVQASSQGHLPSGRYFDMSEYDIKTERETFLEGLEALQIKPDDVFSFEFSDKKTAFTMGKNGLQGSQAHIMLGSLKLTLSGELPHVCSKGLLINASASLENVIKYSAQIFSFLLFSDNPYFEKKVWFLENSKALTIDDSEKACQAFFTWFLEYRNTWFPMLPKWSGFFEKKDVQGFEKAFEKALFERKDPYLNHSLIELSSLPFDSIVERGHDIINTLFTPHLQT